MLLHRVGQYCFALFRPSRVTGVRDTGGGVTAHALDEEVTPVIDYVVGGLEPSLASSG